MVAIVPRMMVAEMTVVMAMMVVEVVAFVVALGQPNIKCSFNLNKMNLYGLVSCTIPSVLLRCIITNFFSHFSHARNKRGLV